MPDHFRASRIRARRAEGRLNSLPVEDLADYSIVGAAKIARGALDFGRWSAAMVKDLGDMSQEVLREIWGASNAKIDELGAKTGKDASKVTKAIRKKTAPTKDELIGAGRAAIEKGESIHDIVATIVNGMIKDGRRDRAGIMADAHKIVQEFMPEATERDVRRAYIEYGKKTYPNPAEIAAFQRKTRQAIKIEEDIARLEKEKLRPELQGYQRDKMDIELRDLVKKHLNKQLDFCVSRMVTIPWIHLLSIPRPIPWLSEF